MEHPDVDFKCIKAKDIQRNPELKKKYRPYQEQCRNAFIQAGYDPEITASVYDGFISNIDPEWLFNCLCTFFKPDVNPIAYEYMTRSFCNIDPDNDDRILPTIWRSRFYKRVRWNKWRICRGRSSVAGIRCELPVSIGLARLV